VQIFCHFLGILFTAWFILDSWFYYNFVYLFAFFGCIPFVCEVLILMSAVKFNKDIKKNKELAGFY
jgi:hypothetical protein